MLKQKPFEIDKPPHLYRLLDNGAFVCIHVVVRFSKDFSKVRGSRSRGFRLQVEWMTAVVWRNYEKKCDYDTIALYFIIPRTGYATQMTENRTTFDLSFLISPDVFYEFYCKGFHLTKKVLIAVWQLSGFSKKCVDEKTSVECSQSRTGNNIVRRILQVSVK